MTFPQRIAAVRKEMKLSQEKFGELANVSQRTIAFWESGERTPSYPVLCDLADKLGISIDYLLGRSDMPKIKKEPAAASSELVDSMFNKIKDYPQPVLEKLLDLMDTIQSYQSSGPAAQAAPGSSDTSDS